VYKKINFILCVSLLLPGIAACGNNVATPTNAVTVLPKECRLLVNEQMPLALDGLVPPNAVISWEANAGSIISAPPGLNALFVAPMQPTVVVISVSITSGTPSVQIPITRECIVTSNEAPTVVSSAPEVVPVSVVVTTSPTIIISEVMANPCGPVDTRKWNEYVELYNYGDQPVDVSSWWLADLGEAGTPELLVPWSQRNPNIPLAGNPVLNSMIIPAKGFAVILSPIYAEGTYPYMMPYQFPQNTVILTPAESRTLGDDFFSIIGDGQGRDVLVLYKGGPSVIQEVVSTYGTPKLDSYVTGVRDDYLDNLPLDLHECTSAERIDPTGLDTYNNWREIANGSPGEAPYP